MKLEILSEEGGVTRIAVVGDVIQQQLSTGQDPLVALLGEDAYRRHVVVNLQGVEQLDSSGVSWLLACHRRFRNAGGTLVLHSLSPFARDVLKVLKMHLVFRLAEDEKSAVKIAQGETP
jgi:anti-anti-sigma factor